MAPELFPALRDPGGHGQRRMLGLWGHLRRCNTAQCSQRRFRDRDRHRGGSEDEPTKSGRVRWVALSLRLRDALAEHYRAKWEPGPSALVLDGVNYYTFREGAWRRIRKRADLGPARLKDLRDTFASQLLRE